MINNHITNCDNQGGPMKYLLLLFIFGCSSTPKRFSDFDCLDSSSDALVETQSIQSWDIVGSFMEKNMKPELIPNEKRILKQELCRQHELQKRYNQ